MSFRIATMAFLFLIPTLIHSEVSDQQLLFDGEITFAQKKESLKEALDSFYDPKFDYSKFSGRVTDRDASGNLIKISSEQQNIKFFRSGDVVEFYVANRSSHNRCRGFVRNVEKGYFTLYVGDIYSCWKQEEFFRRGTLIVFRSGQLGARVKDASIYRVVLLKRRKDYFKQLHGVNHFIWSYNQQKVLTAADYDKKIVELQKGKQRALEMLLVKKKDQILLQRELSRRLDSLDRDLEFYRIEKDEVLVDRWHLDHDLGLPVGRRPQEQVRR
ncbi:MAG: hypothetical protein HN509_04925 [Halobacteriovoraceae bacterium]|nr:hypothetical protein [Halobacteriovoraceae bacterium]